MWDEGLSYLYMKGLILLLTELMNSENSEPEYFLGILS